MTGIKALSPVQRVIEVANRPEGEGNSVFVRVGHEKFAVTEVKPGGKVRGSPQVARDRLCGTPMVDVNEAAASGFLVLRMSVRGGGTARTLFGRIESVVDDIPPRLKYLRKLYRESE